MCSFFTAEDDERVDLNDRFTKPIDRHSFTELRRTDDSGANFLGANGGLVRRERAFCRCRGGAGGCDIAK